ncbi:MAG: hypothetical protein ABR908_12805, partial [Terriglobales bacterium]
SDQRTRRSSSTIMIFSTGIPCVIYYELEENALASGGAWGRLSDRNKRNQKLALLGPGPDLPQGIGCAARPLLEKREKWRTRPR